MPSSPKTERDTDNNIGSNMNDDGSDIGSNNNINRRRTLLRKRPISFGVSRNYHGNVYTLPNITACHDEHDDDNDDDDDDATIALSSSIDVVVDNNNNNNSNSNSNSNAAADRMVAMIGVPPEHVPEGILNLIRSHRPFVEHVRVVIADDDGEGNDDDEDKDKERSIDEQEESDSDSGNNRKNNTDRTYLVLVQLLREEDAIMFVEDLDGKPYIAFDDRETCRIERVVNLETTMTKATTENPGETTSSSSSSPLISGQQQEQLKEEGQPQSNGETTTTTTTHHQSLLFHPNFGNYNILSSTTSCNDLGSSSTSCAGNTATVAGSPKEDGENGPAANRSVSSMTTAATDVQNCAVCLEDLGLPQQEEEEEQKYGDDITSAAEAAAAATTGATTTSQPSLLTTVCNHTFHLDCLQRCTGPCPVCRYDHSGLNETLSQCHVCGVTEHNYVCLICGVVSCGVRSSVNNTVSSIASPVAASASAAASTTSTSTLPRFYTSSHAEQHYSETLHTYALDTETQHVYDFCGQGYVHRLVQNKEDGKLVEVNNPHYAATALAGGRNTGERSLMPGLSDVQEGEVVHRKLEGAAERYNSLLKSQLEQQRAFYEERLNEMKREFSAAATITNADDKAEDLVSVLRQERKQVAHRLSSLQRRKSKVLEDATFLKSMNESLEANKPALKHRIQQAGRERNESRDMIRKYLPALEEKITALMLQLEESMEN